MPDYMDQELFDLGAFMLALVELCAPHEFEEAFEREAGDYARTYPRDKFFESQWREAAKEVVTKIKGAIPDDAEHQRRIGLAGAILDCALKYTPEGKRKPWKVFRASVFAKSHPRPQDRVLNCAQHAVRYAALVLGAQYSALDELERSASRRTTDFKSKPHGGSGFATKKPDTAAGSKPVRPPAELPRLSKEETKLAVKHALEHVTENAKHTIRERMKVHLRQRLQREPTPEELHDAVERLWKRMEAEQAREEAWMNDSEGDALSGAAEGSPKIESAVRPLSAPPQMGIERRASGRTDDTSLTKGDNKPLTAPQLTKPPSIRAEVSSYKPNGLDWAIAAAALILVVALLTSCRSPTVRPAPQISDEARQTLAHIGWRTEATHSEQKP